MWKNLITNWTTSIPGALASLCALTEIFDLLPEAWRMRAMAFCAFLVAIGVLASKSQGVSNSPHPVAASVVSESAAAKPPAAPVQ